MTAPLRVNFNRTNRLVYEYTPYEPFDNEQTEEENVFNNTTIYIEAYDLDDNELYIGEVSGEMFSQAFNNKVVNELIKRVGEGETEGTIEDILFFYQDEVNIDDVEEVNDRAKDFFTVVDSYYKGLRGYLLTDGTILEFGENRDHNSVAYIGDGMSVGKFISLGNIRLGNESIELQRKPTNEQYRVLKNVISAYKDDSLYIDFAQYEEGRNYAAVIMSVQYQHPHVEYIITELEAYFDEGKKPYGAYMTDSYDYISESLTQILNESSDVVALNESLFADSIFRKCRTLEDYKQRIRQLLGMGLISVGVLFGSIAYITTLSDSEKRELQEVVLETEDEKENEVNNTVYATDFKASERGREHIKSFEKLRLEPYYATPYEKKKGILTIGYGHKITDAEKDKYKLGTKITEREADNLFDKDIRQAERYVKHLITRGDMMSTMRTAEVFPQALMDVMVSMMFSGYGNFQNSTFYGRLCNCRRDKDTGKINDSDYNYTIASIPNSVIYQGGEISSGLQNRRKVEYKMAKMK